MRETVLDRLLAALPGDPEVGDIRVGAFFTAVVSRTVGLASTLRRVPHASDGPPVPRAGSLLPSGARRLAELARSDSLIEASIGLAALNSTIEVDADRWPERNAAELLLERGRGRRVAVVGSFPFARRLQGVAGELLVFEREPLVGPGQLPAERMPELLPGVEVAAISSTTLLNHTLDEILGWLDPDCLKLLVGPSTPMSPLLLDLGLDALCGSVVVDTDRTLACLSQGATFRQFKGIRHLVITHLEPS